MMKKIFPIFVLSSAMLFGACTNVDSVGDDTKGPGTPEEPVVTPETPVVPSDFGWCAEAAVALTLESDVQTVVSVYSEKDCKGNSLLVEDALLESGVVSSFQPVGSRRG